MKGISREVVPMRSTALSAPKASTIAAFSRAPDRLDFYLNANMVDADSAGRIRKVLQDALEALDKGAPADPPGNSPAGGRDNGRLAHQCAAIDA